MNAKQSYSEKLKDPRWQKKRLEILQRDNWTCRLCGETSYTLHVHHKVYMKDKEPWECLDEYLVTLCEGCHEREGQNMPDIIDSLVYAIKSVFLSDDVIDIMFGFTCLQDIKDTSELAGAISFFLKTDDVRQFVIDLYNEHRKKMRQEYLNRAAASESTETLPF